MKEYSLRLANLIDTQMVLGLIIDSMDRQCFLNAPAGGFSEDILVRDIQKEIEQVKDTNGLYVIENENKEIIAACSFYFTLYRNGYTFIRLFVRDLMDENTEEEILNKVLELCFLDLNYHKLNIEIRSSQLKNVPVYEKCGFRVELCLREHFYLSGGYEDVLHLGLTKENYQRKVIDPEVKVVVEDYEKLIPEQDYKLKTDLPPNKQLLIGENVDLTALTESDSTTIYDAINGSDVFHNASVASPEPVNMQYVQELIRTENNFMTFKGGILFGIRNKEGKIVGIIGSSMIDFRNRNLMISLEVFNSAQRGKGYGSEAIKMFTDFAFLEMNMHRVYLGCFEFNSHARYLYERLGFKREGVNKDFVYRNGNYYSEISFGVLKEEWLRQRGYLKL